MPEPGVGNARRLLQGRVYERGGGFRNGIL